MGFFFFFFPGFNKEKGSEWDHRKEHEYQLSAISPITFDSRLSLVFPPDPELWYFALRIQILIILSESLSTQKNSTKQANSKSNSHMNLLIQASKVL